MDQNALDIKKNALELANRGEFNKAIDAFDKLLKSVPDAETYYFLGLTYKRADDLKKAEEAFKNAIKENKNMAQPYNGMGQIYFARGDYKKAVMYFRLVLKRNPYDFAAYNNLGNVCQIRKQYKEAEKYYLKASKIVPDKPQPFGNLGTVYFELKEYEKSAKYFKKAISKDSGFFTAYYHLGVVQRKLGLHKEAIDSLKNHLMFKPDHADSLRIIGDSYVDLKEFKKGEKYLGEAIKLNPASPHANNSLGNLYRKDMDYAKAIEAYKKAIKCDPFFAGAYSNLGISLSNTGKTGEAIAALSKAVKSDPECAEAYYHLGLVYEKLFENQKAAEAYKKAYEIDGDFGASLAALAASLRKQCEWERGKFYERKLDALTKKQLAEGIRTSEPALLNIVRKMDEKLNRKVAESWSRDFYLAAKDIIKELLARSINLKHNISKRIKIGYLSCDFYDHATAHLMLGFFSRHDRKKFEIFTYSYGKDDKSIYRKKIKADSEHFSDISKLSNSQAALLIARDNIDILVDLKGHTIDSRQEIIAARPAKVNVSWLGFPGTMGASYIDYLVADKIAVPSKKYYSEKIAYLPGYQVNNIDQKISPIKMKRGDFNLPEGSIVFSSFNATYKIDPITFASWMRVLKKVKDSVLWLLVKDKTAQSNLKKEAKNLGVNPERLIFAGNLPKEKHLKRIGLSDIVLDALIYNGHTTTSDCLWAEVPVIALRGKHFASRVSASLLASVGLPELIAESIADYEKLAVDLAGNRARISELKNFLKANKASSVLFNTDGFVKNLEKEFEKMVKKEVGGKDNSK